MEFKDYYRILDVPPSATPAEVRAAYKRQSLRWHPDRNEGRDTTRQMQDVNEAYTILNDEASRRRYDEEYERFCQSCSSRRREEPRREGQDSAADMGGYDYEVRDEELHRDINAARKRAAEYVRELKEALRHDSAVAARAAWDVMKVYLLTGLAMLLLGLLLLADMGG